MNYQIDEEIKSKEESLKITRGLIDFLQSFLKQVSQYHV